MFEALIEECILRNYSKRTIEIYVHYNKHFLKLSKKQPHEITQGDIRWYLGVLIRKGRSPSTVNLAHNALLFYYRGIMKRKFYDIPFQKKHQKVKETLAFEEICRLIDVTLNRKHKLMISMLYATGVRVSELVNIKVNDVDFSRKLLLVREGKGNKDRYTILSDKVINKLHKYLDTRKITSNYVFETHKGHVTSATVQAVLKNAKKKAKIDKIVTPHVLRHSFATHLRDSGVQDSDIQKLLGHKSIKTTQTYATVSVEHLTRISNPYDGH